MVKKSQVLGYEQPQENADFSNFAIAVHIPPGFVPRSKMPRRTRRKQPWRRMMRRSRRKTRTTAEDLELKQLRALHSSKG
jgi:hypothetical protein